MTLSFSTLAACTSLTMATSQQNELTGDGSDPRVITENYAIAAPLAHVALTPARASVLTDTSDRIELLSRLVACAFLPGAKINVSGIDFPGSFGIAPSWQREPLDLKHQELVTACVLVTLNLALNPIAVSMRGEGLQVSEGERANWTLNEGAYGGNLFRRQLLWFACRGTAPADGRVMQDRPCTKQDPAHPTQTLCGMSYLGLCTDVCRHNECAGHDNMITAFLLP